MFTRLKTGVEHRVGADWLEMAVDEQRSQDNPTDQGTWARCAVSWQRSYVSCAFVAVVAGDQGEELVRSPAFRWRKGEGAPVETADAVAALAALEAVLAGEGWERIDEPRDAWYALRFQRSVVPLTQRIAPYRADGALIAFVDPGDGGEPVEPEQAALEPEAPAFEPLTFAVDAERAPGDRLESERLEVAERLEAERTEADRIEAQRLAAERLQIERHEEAARRETERLDAERLETERREAERLEAERLEAERREAERLEAERLEAERLEAERLEAERLEAERLEAERLEAERLEAERLEAERLEAERVEAERLEAERVEAERLEAERVEAERVEAARLAAEQESPLRHLITSYSAEYDRALDVRKIYGGTSPGSIPIGSRGSSDVVDVDPSAGRRS